MHVSVDFGLLIPIRIGVFVELLTLGDYVQEMAAPAMAALVDGEAVEQHLARQLLQIHVERGVNPQTVFVHLIAAIFRLEIAPDFFHIVRRQRIRIFLQVEHDRLALGFRCLRCGNLAVLEHGVKHEVAPPARALRMNDRRIVLRRLGQSG